MIVAAAGLIILGGFSALLGFKIFRIMLPIIGFITGIMVGFSGVQGVFGTGVISLSIAIIMALVIGTIMAILSFMFFEIAVIILVGMLGSSILVFLGTALGLEDAGFVMALLAISGFIIGIVAATAAPISGGLVVALTSILGVGFIMAGVMLVIGEVNLDQLDSNGIIPTVTSVVDQSFLWLVAWLGGALIAINFQANTLKLEFMNDMYAFESNKKK